jgi:class 3 adenylate cyclase
MAFVRRLTTILAADVAGYSRLLGAGEEGTLERLKALHRELLDPKIAEHRGRIVKTTGDGLLVEFASVVDAVRCVVVVQQAMPERNTGVAADKHIELRIGINLGDVIVEGDDLYGEGVNIAARIEALADPGEVFVRASRARSMAVRRFCSPSRSSAQSKFSRSTRYVAAKARFGEDIDAALALIDRALALNPSFASGWYWSGWLRLFADQPDLAIQHFETSLRLNPAIKEGSIWPASARLVSSRVGSIGRCRHCVYRSRRFRRSRLPIALWWRATRIWTGSRRRNRSSNAWHPSPRCWCRAKIHSGTRIIVSFISGLRLAIGEAT